MKLKLISSLFLALPAVLAFGQTCPGPAQRNALINLQRAIVEEGTRAGQLPLSDTCGNLRYAQFVEINPTPIAYTPAATGNPSVNYSEFVTDPGGDIYYIDWQGRGLQLTGGGSTCDVDWLQISDNSCPDNIRDSIYHQKYASVGARLVWPGAEFLVNDSTASGIAVVQGSRNARLALYDAQLGTFSMLDHGGLSPTFYMPTLANFVIKTTSGTPQTPIGPQVSHFAVNSQDSTIQAFRYPNTRVDTQTVLNFLYTDGVGKFRSKPVASFPVDVPTIYTDNGTISEARTITINGASGGSLNFDLAGTGSFNISDLGAGISSFSVNGTSIGLFDQSTNGIEFLGSTTSMYAQSGPFLFTDNRAAGSQRGLQYLSNYGADFTSTSLIHKAYAEDLINAALAGVGTVTSVGLSLPSIFSVSGSPVTTSGTLTGALATQTANTVFAGPTSGGAATPTFRALVAADLPAGTGTVTSVGLSLPSIFSVSGSPVTSSGTLTGDLATQTANTVFAGPTSGGAVAPTFRALVAADIPAGAGGFFQDGGNSFGASATLGTNDANQLNFEVNNITRGSFSTGGLFTATDESATTNAVVVRGNFNTNTTGTPAVGLGTAITFSGETSTTANTEMARISSDWQTISPHANRTSNLTFSIQGLGITSNALSIRGNSGLGPRIGVNTTSPAHTFTNSSSSVTDGTTVSTNGLAWAISGTPNWAAGFYNSSSASTANVLMLRSDATDNSTFILGASSGTTRLFSVTAAGRVGVGDSSPETLLDVAGTAGVVRLIGQDNTPTITVDAAGAGTGATASMTNAQSSDLAGRFSITSGTGATTGRWASITFGASFSTTPVVVIGCEDADCANVAVGWYVNVSTSGFEIFATGVPASSTSHDFAFHIIGGK